MIQKLQLIRNVGQFDSVSTGANLPLAKLVLAHAENGRGKTTLAAILRSLATGDPLPLLERRRLSAQHDPHVVVECAGGATAAIFTNGAWSRTLANVDIFDDAFINDNIYSGLAVEPDHRQRLHELVLGAQGVALHRKVEEIAAEIEAHNKELRTRSAAISPVELQSFAVDEFCALVPVADVDTSITETERKLAAIREEDPIRRGPSFDAISLPAFDLPALTKTLKQDIPALDTAAAVRVQQHLAELGQGAEAWLASGLKHISANADPHCPFCVQGLSGSTIIEQYRAYFSAGYETLKRSIADTLVSVNRSHGGDVPAAFERAVRVAVERRQFWARFCNIPAIELDTAEIVRTWRDARDAVIAELQAKQAAPLEARALPNGLVDAVNAYEEQSQTVVALSATLQASNESIKLVKEQAAGGAATALEADLKRLKGSKARHTPATAALCQKYLDEKAAKDKTTKRRDQARADLDKYRTNVFPTYQQSVNDYLQRFNAGFRIDSVTSVNNRSGTSCNYNVIIDTKPVSIAGGTPQPGAPSFRNTLSAGDRNTLALAFFFSTLDNDPNLGTKTVIIDDPVSSLDEHRTMATVHEIRRLVQRVAQVIVLSHDKKFLARIWDDASTRRTSTAIQIERAGQSSTLAAWNVSADATTEYDRRHALLRGYLTGSGGNARDVAAATRPVLEGYIRVAQPEHFPPGSLLGPFLGICTQRVGGGNEILDAERIRELREILEYANRFHHDTNPAWETETINDGELQGFVTRTLAYVRR